METASKDDVSETFLTHLLELLVPNVPATAFARCFLQLAMKIEAYNQMFKLWGEAIYADARVEQAAALRLAYTMVLTVQALVRVKNKGESIHASLTQCNGIVSFEILPQGLRQIVGKHMSTLVPIT